MPIRVEQNHSRHEPDDQADHARAEQYDPAVLLQLMLQVGVFLPAGSEGEVEILIDVRAGG